MGKPDELAALFDMIEDFGTMGTGCFIGKYPDCGHYEGYGYIQRKAREARQRSRAAINAMLGGSDV